jgi:transcription-repair coupling factor (superfamily II helicase)
LAAAAAGTPAVFVLSVASLTMLNASPESFQQQSFALAVGDTDHSPEGLAQRLVELDYDNEVEVHTPGEFAHRGGIVDVYSPRLKPYASSTLRPSVRLTGLRRSGSSRAAAR